MATYRIMTYDEINAYYEGVGSCARVSNSSWSSTVRNIIGRTLSDLSSSGLLDYDDAMLRIGNGWGDVYIYRFNWPRKWIIEIPTGIKVNLIQIEGQSIQKGGVFFYNSKPYIIESISKNGSNVLINEKHNIDDIIIVSNEIGKNLL